MAFTVLAVVTPAAVAHGDEHMAKRQKYDASQVDMTAFGGNPGKVVRTVKVDMTGMRPAAWTTATEERTINLPREPLDR